MHAEETVARTPAPWSIEPRTEHPNGHVNGVFGPHGEEIVVTDSGFYPPTIADARLISAAPDLLHACEMALNDRMYKDWPAIADHLIAAIAKATGGAQ